MPKCQALSMAQFLNKEKQRDKVNKESQIDIMLNS